MPILMKAEVHGQTRAGYEAVFGALAPLYTAAPGFIAHVSHELEGGWCVMDIWQSKDDFQRFFVEHVVHRLPNTVRPKIHFQSLHDALSVRCSPPNPAARGPGDDVGHNQRQTGMAPSVVQEATGVAAQGGARPTDRPRRERQG